MTINLNTDELVGLVGKHVDSLGLKGNYKVTFKKGSQNNIDTSIEILPDNGTADVNETEAKATEFDDSLIK